MVEPILIAAAASGLAGYVWFRGKARRVWTAALDEAASRLSAKAHHGDEPELRAPVGAFTVQLRLRQLSRGPRGALAICETSLPPGHDALRLYVGWDIQEIPPDIRYLEAQTISQVGYAGELHVRGEQQALAQRCVSGMLIDLREIRRESNAEAIEVLARGGSLRLAVHGLRASAYSFERMIRGTAHLADLLVRAAGGAELPRVANAETAYDVAPGAVVEVFAPAACGLCTESRAGDQRWVSCFRCRTAYHERCWIQATGCIAKDCGETRAEALT